MLDKYLLTTEDGVFIGLKYHLQKQSVSMGGLTKWVRVMEGFLQAYFRVDDHTTAYPQRNKVRYDFKIDRKKFLEALEEMQKQFIVVTPVDRLERVMR